MDKFYNEWSNARTHATLFLEEHSCLINNDMLLTLEISVFKTVLTFITSLKPLLFLMSIWKWKPVFQVGRVTRIRVMKSQMMKRLFFLFCIISAKHNNLLRKNGIASIQRQHYNQYNRV
jgi:hypothetical protein